MATGDALSLYCNLKLFADPLRPLHLAKFGHVGDLPPDSMMTCKNID
jgi:hypothetical protein